MPRFSHQKLILVRHRRVPDATVPVFEVFDDYDVFSSSHFCCGQDRGPRANTADIRVRSDLVLNCSRHSDDMVEPKQPHTRKAGSAKLMRIFMGKAARWHGEPLHDAIVKQLRMLYVAGATVYRGILGYGAKGHTHKRPPMQPYQPAKLLRPHFTEKGRQFRQGFRGRS